MMKPKFDDVVEYVKAGEDDPEMEEMLHLHPDGQELLKQARFICKMLQHQSESTDDGDIAAGSDKATGSPRYSIAVADSMGSMREPPRSRTFYQSAPLRAPTKRSSSIGDMIEGEGRRSEDLGTLEIAEDDEKVSVTYHASDSVMMRYGKPFIKYLVAQADIEGIEIRGRGITMSLPDTIPASDPMTIRVTAGLRRLPARGLKLIFMPESGPFVRHSADDDGLVQIPAPVQPGALRIDEPELQLLRIKIKK